MAYCSYCAAVLDAGVVTCARCGQRAPATPVPVPPPVVVVNARPSPVTLASVILLISCLVSFLSTASIFITPNLLSRLPAVFLVRSIGFLALWIVLTILVWQRQAWARIAIVLLVAWSLGNLMLTGLRVGLAIFALAVPLLIDLLRIGAAVLLFRPQSSAWFKK